MINFARVVAALIAAALIGWGVADVGAQTRAVPRPLNAPQQIDVKSVPIDSFEPRDPSRKRFGALEFRGGLELSSSARAFGGISGLKVFPDGSQFLAVTDRGRWLKGRIVYRHDVPIGIADAEMAPVLGPDGRPIVARGWYDTESLSEENGVAYLGLERVNKILRFEFGRHGLSAYGQTVAAPLAIDKLPNNKGLECLAVFPKGTPKGGTLVAIAERALNPAGDYRGFLVAGAASGEFAIQRHDSFDISDCSLLPDGDLLVLERHFTWATGLAIRLRRVARSAIAVGATAQGVLLFEADLGYQIDNMEALSVYVDKDGTTILTMMSDDNFSMLQRTLLLQFALVGD